MSSTFSRNRPGRRWAMAVGAIAALVLAAAAVGVLAAPRDAPRPAPAPQPSPDLGYLVERTKFLSDESQRFLGNSLVLGAAEQRVNGLLMAWKQKEYNVPEADFLPAHSFFLVREAIERSPVYKFIKRMPKGAVLHVHDLSAANADYVVQNVTYRDHLWGRVSDAEVQLRFAAAAPAPGWELVADLRRRAASVADFDARLERAFTITDMNPAQTYPDQKTVWHAFDTTFGVLFSLLTYAPVFRDYFRRTLQEFYEDNVMYVEIRGVLPTLFELDGREYGQLEVAALYQQVADEFRRVHPDFLGVRLIYAPSRHVSVGQVHEYVAFFRQLKTQFPDFVAGFDLVAHEDDGRPLIDFVPSLLQLRRDVPDVKYFFHAGETNWEQSLTDENLVDAVLLNTTRIGHGFAIDKHPKVMEVVKSRGIGIELNPISNQVLNLVRDLRNHPGAALLADDYPVVISSDDPGMWGARGLSYDFYEAFMGMTGLKADLRTLKQLTINSIRYSAMGELEKEEALSRLAQRWQEFIADVDNSRLVLLQLRGLSADSTDHDNSIHSGTSWEA
ncbi:adenosine deaminase 2-like [Frankliniella occidentalis]|uniref:Adenosine deaminase n=1 Tax=Frankliniella occidentalis TaxID=133901 RepID=A0A6J1SQY9_FRAOC|nr:adenosine deaminase 2-like [Frankliniella occidentalis]